MTKNWKSTLALLCFCVAAHSGVALASGHKHENKAHSHTHEHKHDTSAEIDAHTRQDIDRHRAMARAHENAAQCLEKGTNHDACTKALQADCKGLALGKHCGMRHAH